LPKKENRKKNSHAVPTSPIGVQDPKNEPSEKFHRGYLGH